MRRRTINLVIFLLFLFEGTVFLYINPSYYGSNISIVPRFVTAAIILIAFYKDKTYALILGIIFGLFYDVIYGNIIGLHLVGLGAVGYFSGWLTQFFHPTFFIYLITQLFGFLIYESFLAGMLSLFRMINYQLEWELIHVIIPSVIINLLFAALIYSFSEKLSESREQNS